MNETKSYKNINLSDLGTRQKIVQVASKVALFVPRLLGKLATKLVVNPITKLTTGQTYEDVRNQAVEITMDVQKAEANKLDAKIEEGYQNLEDWQEDTEYYISNLGKYKRYQSTIEDLERKQTRLLTSPKKLLVAKHYRYVMSKFITKHKEEKAKQKEINRLKEEYLAKAALLQAQQEEMQALRMALRESEEKYSKMKNELDLYSLSDSNIVEENVPDADYVEINGDEQVVAPAVEEAVVEEAPNVEVETPAPVVEGSQPENTSDEKVTFKSLDPNGNYRIDEEPVYRPVSQESADALRQAGYPAVAVEASPEEQEMFNKMANMAVMGQVPVADAQTLETYGLSEEEPQKHL